ncbi:hypothetical protein JZN77_004810 [Escherichia coli]|nr:hypothetical protein [Escherichia coli]EHC9566751.1 hypothetical protein [Escherichia coli]
MNKEKEIDQFIVSGARVTVYKKVVRWGNNTYQRHLLPPFLRIALAQRGIFN